MKGKNYFNFPIIKLYFLNKFRDKIFFSNYYITNGGTLCLLCFGRFFKILKIQIICLEDGNISIKATN